MGAYDVYECEDMGTRDRLIVALLFPYFLSHVSLQMQTPIVFNVA